MKVRKIWGISSFILIILVPILCAEYINDFSLADFIFSKLGVNTWSNGITGLHYTAVMAVLLMIAGIVGVVISEDAVHKNFGKIVFCFILFGSILLKPVYISAYGFIKSNMDGLSSMEYIRDDSKLNFKGNDFDKSISFNGQIKLKNYSDETKEFFIKLIFEKETIEFLDFPIEKEITVCDESKKPIRYILGPKSEASLNAEFSVKDDELYRGAGSMSFDVIIFNETDEQKFLYRR